MSRDSRWLALLALPVLCCAGHAVLLVVGVGSVTAVLGGAVGSAVVAAAGLLLLLAAAVVVLRRRRHAEAPAGQPEPAVRVPDGGAR